MEAARRLLAKPRTVTRRLGLIRADGRVHPSLQGDVCSSEAVVLTTRVDVNEPSPSSQFRASAGFEVPA